MTASKESLGDFQMRVARIKNPRNTSYYDPHLRMHIPKRMSQTQIKTARARVARRRRPTALLAAALVGGLALILAQVLRIRMLETAGGGIVTLMIELCLAAAVLSLLSMLFDQRGSWARMAQITGVVAMMAAGHNLIWQWPEAMAALKTQAHVDQVIASTEPRTLMLAGLTYRF